MIKKVSVGIMAILIFLLISPIFSMACTIPFHCYQIVAGGLKKIVKFTSRSAYESWLNASDRSNCTEPFYSKSTSVEVICFDAIYKIECTDDSGSCTQ